MVKIMKNKWEIIPNVSINGMAFGTDRKTVRNTLGKPKNTFRKTSNSSNTTDAYPGFHVYYSDDDKLQAIELFGTELVVSINSQQVFPGTIDAIKNLLPDLKEEYGDYTSYDNSIGLTVEEGSIVSILAGCKNYFVK